MTATDNQHRDLRAAVRGTGIIGSAMARNLVKAGLRTTVWDRSPAATAPLAQAGAAAGPGQAVRDARVVITMLRAADVVKSVIFDDEVAQAFAGGAVWAQIGTVGLAATTELAERLDELRPDVLFVDAPVSGSKGPAETWAAAHLASGPPAARPVVSQVFSAVGAASDGSLPWLAALSRQWRTAVDAGHGREAISAARLALGRQQ